jgi:hypothetical protein
VEKDWPWFGQIKGMGEKYKKRGRKGDKKGYCRGRQEYFPHHLSRATRFVVSSR